MAGVPGPGPGPGGRQAQANKPSVTRRLPRTASAHRKDNKATPNYLLKQLAATYAFVAQPLKVLEPERRRSERLERIS